LGLGADRLPVERSIDTIVATYAMVNI
jgi:hypothetical protein